MGFADIVYSVYWWIQQGQQGYTDAKIETDEADEAWPKPESAKALNHKA